MIGLIRRLFCRHDYHIEWYLRNDMQVQTACRCQKCGKIHWKNIQKLEE